MNKFLLACLLMSITLPACKDSANFSSGSTKNAQRGGEPKEPTSKPEPIEEAVKRRPDKPTPSQPQPQSATTPAAHTAIDTQSTSVAPPNNPTVVTKGSFSAWADPPAPQVRQDYYIYIEIRFTQLPDNYGLNDLDGFLHGTDNYRQTINSSPQAFPASGNGAFNIAPPEMIVQGNTVLLRVMVPGALQPAVRDTVRIGSRTLNEAQTLTIQFQ